MADGRNRSNAFTENNIFSDNRANRVKEMNSALEPQLGYVLVFDMDQTITGEYFDVVRSPYRPLDINPTVVHILKLAVQAKATGKVSAILLLTNNSDEKYISKMVNTINFLVLGRDRKRSDFVFDDGLKAGDPGRNVPPGKPVNHALKSFRDIARMLVRRGLPIEKLESRTLFFDDQPGHVLTAQLIKAGFENHFVHIKPGYQQGVEDETDWSVIEEALVTPAEGGRRSSTIKRKRKIKSRKTKKTKSKRRI